MRSARSPASAGSAPVGFVRVIRVYAECRAEFDREIAAGSLYVGSPETVARKIAATVRAIGASRFDLKYSAGTLGHERLLRSIELYGREVIPRVRRLLADAPPVRAEATTVADHA